MVRGRVDPDKVSSQLQTVLKARAQTNANYWAVFQETTAKLQRKGLLDDRNRPTLQATEEVPEELLKSSLLQAHRTIGELEEEAKRRENEISQVRSQLYSTEEKLRTALTEIQRMSPATQFISKEALQRGLQQFLGYNVLPKISEVAKNDLEDAIKCLYHGIATASAMVSLRASEEAVRQYYQFKTSNNPGKKSWKEILDELVQRDDVNKTLVGHLNYIREKRNEAEHPQKIFDQFEAENTFQTVINAIREIYKETAEAK